MHVFHKRRPNKDWYSDWYKNSWDKENERVFSKEPINNIQRLRQFLYPIIPPRTYSQPHASSIAGFCYPILKNNFKVLDIGCGYGEQLQHFKPIGCNTFGIEASPHRKKFVEHKGFLIKQLKVEDLDESTYGTRFDLIYSTHVLEHIYNLHDFMEVILKTLKPNGWLCLAVPDIEKDFLLHNFLFALHIHFFSKYSIIKLLENYGFVINKVELSHEIRILAQYCPTKIISTNNDIYSNKPKNIDKSFLSRNIFNNILGKNYYDFKNKPIFLRWEFSSNRLKNVFDVIHSSKYSEPTFRGVSLTWSGSDDLPIHFSCSRKTSMPFCVK